MEYSSEHPLHQLRDIHRLMQRTSKFIGLSGLSGVGAGAFAVVGSLLAQWYLQAGGLDNYEHSLHYWPAQAHPWGIEYAGWDPPEGRMLVYERSGQNTRLEDGRSVSRG